MLQGRTSNCSEKLKGKFAKTWMCIIKREDTTSGGEAV
jgi:hypothetical protein